MTDEQHTLTDIAGNEIRPGDDVVYPQMSGRSVQMVRGKLVAYNGKTAKVERVEGSRWRATYGGETRYRDKRTGKGIDPYRSNKHYRVQPTSIVTHKVTGEVIRQDENREAFNEAYDTIGCGVGPSKSEWVATWYRGELHDYVEEYTAAPKPSIIHNVKNIVKVVVNNG